MTVATPLDVSDIRARIKERREAETQAEIDYMEMHYKYVRPLAAAANNLIEYVQNPDGRYMLGLHDIDVMTRGFGRGELVYIAGQYQQGKTQVALTAINNNPDRHVVFFTPDEVAELVLAKLIGMRYGLQGEVLEDGIKNRDPETIDTVKRAASRDFRQLTIIDAALSFNKMLDAVKESEDYHQDKVEVVVIDYFETIPFSSDVELKNSTVKQWTKDVDAVVLCLRQGHFTETTRGKSGGSFPMRYGGAAEAMFLLEAFRKKDDTSLSGFDRQLNQNTVTLKLTKNKRPPNKTGQFDFYLDPNTGLIRPLRCEDRVASGASTSDALTAVRAVNQ